MIRRLLLVAVVLPLLLTGLSLPAARAAGGTLTLTFYDANGTLLTAAQVHTIAKGPGTGQNAGYDADAFVDPATLEMVGGPNPLGSGLSAALPSSPAAVDLAMNWPASTANGYSMVVLDNGGAGFSTGGTVNFTFAAANDAKRRLDAALAARTSPTYSHSAAFDAAYDAAVGYLALANAVGASESTKGKNGSLALDRLDVATQLMLKEYGTAFASANTAVADRWSGYTIDESKATGTKYKTPVDTAQAITTAIPATETGWVRFVLDPTVTTSTYANEISYAHAHGLKVMVEPVDSAYCDASSPTPGFTCSLSAYHQAFVNATTQLTGTAAPDAYEVGNEVNGDWLLSSGTNTPAARVADAAAWVTANAPGAGRVLTLFWQLNTAGAAGTSVFNWSRANLPATVRADLDTVLLSTYVEQAPLGLGFDEVMTQLRTEFTGKTIGIGELGYWIQGQRYWWAYSNIASSSAPTVADLQPVADQYYRASLGYQGSVGGGFWWNFPSQVVPSTAFQGTFAAVRDSLGSGSGGGGGGGGGGGNTHGGTWAGRAVLPATASYKDLYQAVTVSPSTTDTASVWVKGSGAVKVTVWGNASWTTSLATVKCTAGGTWSQCTLPSFSTGSRSKVYLDLESAYNGAGTVYVDDVVLGTSGGANLVTNPDFESGATGWSSTDAAVWSVVQP